MIFYTMKMVNIVSSKIQKKKEIQDTVDEIIKKLLLYFI
jgi:hypothetical protein